MLTGNILIQRCLSLGRCALWGLLVTALNAGADPIVIPQSTKQAIDLGEFVFRVIVMAVVGKFLFFVATVVFVLLHLLLLGLLVAGVIRKRYWRWGIKFCLTGLVLFYGALLAGGLLQWVHD